MTQEERAKIVAAYGVSAKEDDALDALALRYPGEPASPAVSVPGARVHIGDASVSACWDIFAAAWSANIVGGKDRYWYSGGHTTAAEALDAARAKVAESVRQMRADADQLEALLGVAEVPNTDLCQPTELATEDRFAHYKSGGLDVYDAIDMWGLGFLRGNALKYLFRAGRKPDSAEIDDLRKARWYIDREIARREPEEGR